MPSLHLMVNFGSDFQVHQADQATPVATCSEGWVVGLWNSYQVVDWQANVRFFGVHFKPDGAYPFLQLPLSELHNQVVSLEALWNHLAAELRQRLYDAPTVRAGFAVLERLLLARLCVESNELSVVHYAVNEIMQNHGLVSIRELSKRIGISQNHLCTQFKRIV
ncbi:MAG: hypothetical protein KF726_28030, partial [Anaerolineae bacterium]|nr:hypothetical protein [Anaerolineae bacterium]